MKQPLRSLAFLSSAFTLAAFLIAPALSYAAATPLAVPTLTISSSVSSVQAGSSFSLKLAEDGGAFAVSKVSTSISFPSANVQYVSSSSAGSPFSPVVTGSETASDATSSSHLNVNVSSKTAVRESNLVLTVTMKAVSAGKVALGLTSSSVVVTSGTSQKTMTPLVNSASLTVTAVPTTQLQAEIAKGDAAIALRLKDLSAVLSKLSTVVTLKASDKAALQNQINSELTGLAALKVKLDHETTLGAATADVNDIFSDFRVFLLILPKVALIETADRELVASSQLANLATKLAPKVQAASGTAAGKVALVAFNDMKDDYKDAQASAATIEINVLPLQPSDYDQNPKILSGDNAQLITANKSNNSAYTEANAVLVALSL